MTVAPSGVVVKLLWPGPYYPEEEGVAYSEPGTLSLRGGGAPTVSLALDSECLHPGDASPAFWVAGTWGRDPHG
jgi:hypothetical protein